MLSAVDVFVSLFRGRGDAYGSWEGPRAVREPLNHEKFYWHLRSPHERDWIGVYNVIGDRCSWGCVDIDHKDIVLARNVRMALWRQDVPAWIESTTRGFHVWVFPEERLMDALTMRQALTAACKAVDYDPKEVFPKQTKVTGNGVGNWVRLPYNGYMSEGDHIPRTFLEADDLPFIDALRMMDEDRARTGDLERLASYLPTPQPVNIPVDFNTGLEVEARVREIGGMVHRLWRDGPKYGHDRSSTLARLAHYLREDGVEPSEAFAIVHSADERWGKGFAHRGESGVLILQRLIENTYGKAGWRDEQAQ